MDSWSALIYVVVPTLGAMLFLKFFADEMESAAQILQSFRIREEKRYQQRLKARSADNTAEKAA